MVQCIAEISDEMHSLARKIVDACDAWKGEAPGDHDWPYWRAQEEHGIQLAELVLLWECTKDKGNAPQDEQAPLQPGRTLSKGPH